MRAIDVHVHPSTEPFKYERRWGKEVADFLPKYYRIKEKKSTDEEMAQEFRDLDIKALLIGWDAQAESGYETDGTNDEVATLIKKFPDVFIGGWAMIDPWKGRWAVKELERCIRDLGLNGLKFQQSAQGFFPMKGDSIPYMKHVSN